MLRATIILTAVLTAVLLPATALAQPTVPLVPVPRRNPDAPASAYLNGLWYEADASGVRFQPGDRYSIAGVFTADRPEVIGRTIDLGGAYVVPPFGEAHNHNVDGPRTLPAAARYLAQGIFYYKNPNDVAAVTAAGAGLFNKPDALDVVFAHGGLSVAKGHPEGLYRWLAKGYGLDPDRLDGQAYFDVPTPEAVARRWPEVLRGRPDFIKLYLLDAADQGGGRAAGLPPAAFRRAAALAKEAGLRTTVHVETAADLALAVDAGTTEAAHLPGYSWKEGLGADAYRISDDLARTMAARGFIVVTTTVVTEDGTPATPEAAGRKRQVQALQAENLRRLHSAGVPLAVGADSYTRTSLDEARNLRKFGAFTDAQLLRLWVETGPRSVFPARAIGRLAPGFEASFLTTAADPTEDFSRVEQIRTRVKQGVVLGGG